jgi:hypothetical protein
LFSSAPLGISAELKYKGKNDTLSITHCTDIGYIILCFDDGSPVISVETGAEKISFTRKKQEIISITQEFTGDLYKQSLIRGNYTAKVYVDFVITDTNEKVSMQAELPITIR